MSAVTEDRPLVPPTMDYSHGVLDPLCSPLFSKLREQLGPYLVDKTKLIENIVHNSLNGSADLVLRPRHCGKSTMLHMLKLLHWATSILCSEACLPDLFSVSP